MARGSENQHQAPSSAKDKKDSPGCGASDFEIFLQAENVDSIRIEKTKNVPVAFMEERLLLKIKDLRA